MFHTNRQLRQDSKYPNEESAVSISIQCQSRPVSSRAKQDLGQSGEPPSRLEMPAKDAFFCEDNSSTQEDELVRFGIDMTKLSDYLDNIIKVVNQHAKLLDDVSCDLVKRPYKNEAGEFFSLLAAGFPYEQALGHL